MPANQPLFPDLPLYNLGVGIKTNYGTILPPAIRVTYVCSAGFQSGAEPNFLGRILPTLAQGLAECRPGVGDVVVILPNHAENVVDATMLNNLVAGTRIIGLGSLNSDSAPTFTWTAAAAQWAITQKNVEIQGLRLLCDGFNGVTKAINITAPGVTIANNYIRWSSGAANLAAIGIEVGSTATDCVIQGNYITGVAAGVTTNGINVVGATVPSRLTIAGNNIQAACTAATGLINITVAALNVTVAKNILSNITAASAAVMTLANVATTGVISDNYMAILANGTPPVPIVFGAASIFKCFQNFCSDEPASATTGSGLLRPPVVT